MGRFGRGDFITVCLETRAVLVPVNTFAKAGELDYIDEATCSDGRAGDFDYWTKAAAGRNQNQIPSRARMPGSGRR